MVDDRKMPVIESRLNFAAGKRSPNLFGMESFVFQTPRPRVSPRLKVRRGLGLVAMWGRGAVVERYVYFFFGLNGSIFFMNVIVIIFSSFFNIIRNNILRDTDCGGGLLYS